MKTDMNLHILPSTVFSVQLSTTLALAFKNNNYRYLMSLLLWSVQFENEQVATPCTKQSSQADRFQTLLNRISARSQSSTHPTLSSSVSFATVPSAFSCSQHKSSVGLG